MSHQSEKQRTSFMVRYTIIAQLGSDARWCKSLHMCDLPSCVELARNHEVLTPHAFRIMSAEHCVMMYFACFLMTLKTKQTNLYHGWRAYSQKKNIVSKWGMDWCLDKTTNTQATCCSHVCWHTHTKIKHVTHPLPCGDGTYADLSAVRGLWWKLCTEN